MAEIRVVLFLDFKGFKVYFQRTRNCRVIPDFPPYLKMVSIGKIKEYSIFNHSIQLERWIRNRFGKCPYFPETDLESTVNPGKLTRTAKFC